MTIIGIDIGGANIKLANDAGQTLHRPFALWRHPDKLSAELASSLDQMGACDELRVTMTGELCDGYPNRDAGVRAILKSVDEATPSSTRIRVWSLDGKFVSPTSACQHPTKIGAANWLALALWVARENPTQSGLLIDIGSTTTDVIAIENGRALPTSLTDSGRLMTGELIYSGIGRTPICALVPSLPLGQDLCPVAAEFFATTADVYTLLGFLLEDASNFDTADGRARTMTRSRERLARSICVDASQLTDEAIERMARHVADHQLRVLAEAAQSVARAQNMDPTTWIASSGSGEFLIEASPSFRDLPRWSLSAEHGSSVAAVACAYALTKL